MSRPFTPRPYQELIAAHEINVPRCAVWAGMGMGKTSASLLTASRLLMVDTECVLVMAPYRVAQTTWPDECKKWSNFSGLRVSPILGTPAERRRALDRKAEIYTINYDNLIWLIDELGGRWPFDAIIADESTRLKSFRLKGGGRRALALSRVAHHRVKRFIELTGTPSPNGLIDLWGQMWFIDQGERLGRTFSGFRDRWFRKDYDGSIKPLPNAQDEIQERLRDVCLTIDARDWFDLKAPIVSNIYVDLPGKTRQLYRQMERELFLELECGATVEAFNAAAKSQKLLQLASGAVYVDPRAETDADPRAKEWRRVHDEKLNALEDVISEAAGAPVLVAYHFRSDLARLLHRFPQGRHLDKDPQTIAEWNAGKIPILFAHPQSAGHGLNLQDGGNILVFFSHNWNLEDRLQIMERIGPVRQLQAGYDRPVFVYNIVAKDTMDELVLERIDGKREVQDILLDAMRRRGMKV